MNEKGEDDPLENYNQNDSMQGHTYDFDMEFEDQVQIGVDQSMEGFVGNYT